MRRFRPLSWSSVLLISGAAACVAAALYVFYVYSWTNQRDFGSTVQRWAYYGIPLAASLALLAGLRLSQSSRANYVLLIGSAAVSLCVAELAVALYDARDRDQGETIWPVDWTEARKRQIERLAAPYGVRFDTRLKLDVIADLRSRGVEAVPAVAVDAFLIADSVGVYHSPLIIDGSEVVPFGGVSGALTVLCNETGEYVLYDSDERGFSNPRGLWDASSIQIGIVGDSYAHGFCVSSDRTFAALIRERFPRTLNLGVAGTGPLAQYAILEEYLAPKRPPVLLWFYFEGNDLINLVSEATNVVLARYLTGPYRQEVLHRQRDFDQALLAYLDDLRTRAMESRLATSGRPGALSRLKVMAKLSHLRRKVGLVAAGDTPAESEKRDAQTLEQFDQVVRAMRATVNSWAGSPYFIYLPHRDRFARNADYRRDEVLARVRAAGLPVIDIADEFVKHPDPLSLFPFRRFGHYNNEGHRIVATAVLRALAADGIVP